MIVRADLPPGLQAAQAVHAALKFPLARPPDPEMNLVLLQVGDEWDLHELAEKLSAEGTEHVWWFEPDVDSFTSIASAPSRHFSSLPLLLREGSMA